MRNYWPNKGAEDTTREQWAGNPIFGFAQSADSEFSDKLPRSGNRSVRAIWPEPDGSGEPAAIAEYFHHEGVGGKWRVGAWIYVPSGNPDIEFGSAWNGDPLISVNTKDEWVNVESVVNVDELGDNVHWMKLQTAVANPLYKNYAINPRGTIAFSFTGGAFQNTRYDGYCTFTYGHITSAIPEMNGSTTTHARMTVEDNSPGGSMGWHIAGNPEGASPPASGLIPVTAGKTYTISHWVRSSQADTGWGISTRFSDGTNWVAGGYTHAPTVQLESDWPYSWTQVSQTITAPAGAVEMSIYSRSRTRDWSDADFKLANGTLVDASLLMIVESDSVIPFYDGDRVDDISGDYEWTGTPHESPSLRKAVAYMDDIYAYPGETGVDSSEPEVKVEISWEGKPFDSNPTWEDITEYVQAINPSIGRNSEIGSVEAGTCPVVLDNTEGRFTPKREYFRNIVKDPSMDGLGSWNLSDGFTIGSYGNAPGETNGKALAVATSGVYKSASQPKFSVTPGDEWRFSAYAWVESGATGSGTLLATLFFYDASGAFIGILGSGTTWSPSDAGAGWILREQTGTVPAGAVTAQVLVRVTAGLTDGTYLVDTVKAQRKHPYYPNVKPRRPVRITAGWDGAIWPIFRGHVDRWPAETAAGTTSTTIELVDAFGVLSKKTLKNLYVDQIDDYALRVLYPLNDGPESFSEYLDPKRSARIVAPPSSSVAEGLSGNIPTVSAGASDLFPNKAGVGSVSISGTTWADTGDTSTHLSGRIIEFPIETLDTTDTSPGWSISFWHGFDGKPAVTETGTENIGPCTALRVETESFGDLFATVIFNAHPTGKGYTVYWPDTEYGDANNIALHFDGFADGNTHYMATERGNHVVISFSNDCRNDGSNVPGLGLFVNGWGSYKEIPGSSLLGLKKKVRFHMGANYYPRPAEGIGGSDIMAHDYRAAMFSIHDMPIDGWNLSLLGYRASGNPDEKAGKRINYFLDLLGWPQDLRHIDWAADESVMRFVSWESNPNALDELRAPALDTNALLFVNAAGYVTLHSRRLRQNPIPHFIFDHDAGTGIESPMNFDMSEQDIVNVANVDNAYGIKSQIRNEASIEEYDEVAKNISLRLARDSEAIQFGYWQVNRFSEAQLRIDGVVIKPDTQADGALWGHVLGMTPSVVVGLRGLPDNAPDAEQDYYVEAVSHEIERSGDRLYWRTTLQVSPATDHEAWILGDSTYGVLGETTRLHY